MNRNILLTVCVLSAFNTIWAQPVPTKADLRKITDQIMDQMGRGGIDAGFKLLKPRTIVPEAEFDAMVGQAKLQIPMIAQRFGDPLGSEFIREECAGQSVIKFTYISRYDRHALRWRFYGYRGSKGWVINTFAFDDKLQELL